MDKTLSISSLDNPRIKEALHLREKRERDKTKKFLIEGFREIVRAMDAKVSFQTLFFCPELFLGTNEKTVLEKAKKEKVILCECSEKVFRKISYRDRPDGLLAIALHMNQTLESLEEKISKKKSPFFVVAEAIEKPGNLGTILRSSDAAGCDGVIVVDRCTDIYNPNVVRASVGTLFTVPVVEATSAETLRFLRDKNIRIIAATPSAKKEFTDTALTGAVAIAVGTEQLGLSDFWMDSSDIKVRIAMHGVADSLNVATATTLLLYEVVRQRKFK